MILYSGTTAYAVFDVNLMNSVYEIGDVKIGLADNSVAKHKYFGIVKIDVKK